MGSASLNTYGVRAYAAVWAGAWHTEGMAGAPGLLILLCSQRTPLGKSLLPLARAFGVQGSADTSSMKGMGSGEAAARLHGAVKWPRRGCAARQAPCRVLPLHKGPAGPPVAQLHARSVQYVSALPGHPRGMVKQLLSRRHGAGCSFGQGDAVRTSLPRARSPCTPLASERNPYFSLSPFFPFCTQACPHLTLLISSLD